MILIILLLTTQACRCAVAEHISKTDRIVNGIDASIKKYPFTVSLRHKADNSHYCGGSIIDQNWILTAAHCVFGKLATEIVACVGTNSLKQGGEYYDSDVLLYPANYNKTDLFHDIGLVRTTKSIKFTDSIQPIKLSLKYIDSHNIATVAGFGYGKTKTLSEILQEISVTTISNEMCATFFNLITSFSLCTTSGATGTCSGDSGSALVLGGEQIGIASFAGDPCGKSIPDGYLRISKYIDWINTVKNIYAKDS